MTMSRWDFLGTNGRRVMTMNRWEEAKTEASRVIPDPRVSHTMTSYNDKLILFGGAGAYLKNLHMMPSYNDIWELDTRS